MQTIDDGIQEGKADFDDIYDRTDPRAYYGSLSELDYEIPAHGAEVFVPVAEAHAEGSGEGPVVLDVCCSYGIVSALMNHDLSLGELYDHYENAAKQGLDRDELIEADRTLFQESARDPRLTTVGLDIATNAIDYALEAGILDRGHAEDLESDDPSPELVADLADVGLVTITGGVGYVGDATFDRILTHVRGEDPPWIAAMSLRWIDFAPVADAASRHGLVTEKVIDPTFRQRRFADDGERQMALDNLAELGIDPSGKEVEGWHHADLYLARPAEEVEAVPAAELLGFDAEVRRLAV